MSDHNNYRLKYKSIVSLLNVLYVLLDEHEAVWQEPEDEVHLKPFLERLAIKEELEESSEG